jgi:hypothetical protein
MNEINDGCQKYEQLFIFGDEKALLEHIETCPECKAEHEKMAVLSALVKEAKPYFKKKRAQKKVAMALCASFLLVFALGGAGLYENQIASNAELLAYYENDISPISQMGFPTDEYGLLLIE